jgi:hypothetical protein
MCRTLPLPYCRDKCTALLETLLQTCSTICCRCSVQCTVCYSILSDARLLCYLYSPQCCCDCTTFEHPDSKPNSSAARCSTPKVTTKPRLPQNPMTQALAATKPQLYPSPKPQSRTLALQYPGMPPKTSHPIQSLEQASRQASNHHGSSITRLISTTTHAIQHMQK